MKIMCVSDIHGSLSAARSVIATFLSDGYDRILLLGDILYHGPRNDLPSDYAPKEVMALFNGYKDRILAVRGNCDTEVDQMVLEFPIMADYIYITSGETVIFATHGHLYSPEKLPPFLGEGSVFISGHTHLVYDHVKDGIRFMNPGSPSIPKDDNAPSYISIDGGSLEIRRLKSDH